MWFWGWTFCCQGVPASGSQRIKAAEVLRLLGSACLRRVHCPGGAVQSWLLPPSAWFSVPAACLPVIDLLYLAGSDCKPCLQEFPDHSAPALEYPNPKSFLPSLIAEDDSFCTSMAEEKASVLLPSAATAPGRKVGAQHHGQRGLCSDKKWGKSC